ncbi:conserved hypothetical protein [Culex quinquefasciatus]|uniref:Chitin-binding type-2 domain-containing protein n=1 Tax=Culex quinquefasciatus TaxID=7176 RepID=B0WMH6_CULQU|nr:conserved hypothetical protein [Culex quinquefasciatus]|eukprot:XP_001849910.1 conserved hypothetical protein [Culex quinquefasciatus]
MVGIRLLFAVTMLVINSTCVQIDEIDCSQTNAVVFYPHPTSCQGYLTCFLGQVIEGQCSFGLYFDLERQICEAQSRVRCEMPYQK